MYQTDLIQTDEDQELVFTETIPHSVNSRTTLYVAAICGSDPVYGLRRKFVCPDFAFSPLGTKYTYSLTSSLYEIGYKSSSRTTGCLIARKRYWLIVFNGDAYTFAYEELSFDNAILTAFNIWAQLFGLDAAIKRFFHRDQIQHDNKEKYN